MVQTVLENSVLCNYLELSIRKERNREIDPAARDPDDRELAILMDPVGGPS